MKSRTSPFFSHIHQMDSAMNTVDLPHSLTGDWLQHPATQGVLGILEESGNSAYIVGGTVRNALLGMPVSDIDIATDATPEQVISLAKAQDLRVIATGLEHGTVTIILDGEPVEVTTFRQDVATDGRRAVVAFTADISEDARRRDFTMNAIYADRRGRIVDPLNGMEDIVSRRIRFIEDADRRLREDHLRALRFFRFTARYGDPRLGHDDEAMTAIARNLDGIASLSAERIGSEILKILSVTDPYETLRAMADVGLLAAVLPGASLINMLDLCASEKKPCHCPQIPYYALLVWASAMVPACALAAPNKNALLFSRVYIATRNPLKRLHGAKV